MVFYFTGTGNSLQAAMAVCGENEEIVSIGECVKNNRFEFELRDGESVGFVCPTYFYGIPSIMHYFLRKLKLSGARPSYAYGLLTCGGSIGGADRMLANKVETVVGITLDALYSVVMPDNYFLMYNLDSEEKQDKVLAKAAEKLEKIKEKIENHECSGLLSSKLYELTTALIYPFYKSGRRTKKFWTDDTCVGCGTCALRCPAGAIQMIDGKPIWVKERCIHCLQCTRCNAVQYGKASLKHRRYKNPLWRKKCR